MANSGLVYRLFSLSPHIEMLGRRLYWYNVRRLASTARKKPKRPSVQEPLEFSKVTAFLTQCGVDQGALAVVHSAYGTFKGRGYSPNDIVDALLAHIGQRGTLAMPAMPVFDNTPDVVDSLHADPADVVFEYDLRESPIRTGVLPAVLHARPEAIRSRHPINSMVALGPLAEELMRDNLAGETPLPCGTQSSWSRCVDHDAWIIGLGTDLTHSLTMIHVAEDRKDAGWPVPGWYRDKTFLIRDGGHDERRVLRERHPRWGALHFGERTLCRDLMAAGLLQSTTVDGALVEVLSARALISFLDARNGTGYPYFWLGL